MKRLIALLSALLGVGVIAVVAGLYFLTSWAQRSDLFSEPTTYQVVRGQTLSGVANELAGARDFDARLLLIYARLTQRQHIKAGEYRFQAGTTADQLLTKLTRGDVIFYKAQLLEGWTYQQALDYLHSLPKLDVRLANMSWVQQRQLLGVEEDHPEGLFFPDTYRFHSGDSDVSVLRQAYKNQAALLARLWSQRVSNLPYKSPYEALIMASIVEKETAIDSEREQIAGVFIRRLEQGMRLQTDPTVIYGLGEDYQGNLRRKHLKQATPYNTYVIRGLPPTPIALTSERSLYAALHPDASNALYFVARGDGYHQFSATLDEHNNAVRKYQLQRKQDYRSTPAQ